MNTFVITWYIHDPGFTEFIINQKIRSWKDSVILLNKSHTNSQDMIGNILAYIEMCYISQINWSCMMMTLFGQSQMEVWRESFNNPSPCSNVRLAWMHWTIAIDHTGNWLIAPDSSESGWRLLIGMSVSGQLRTFSDWVLAWVKGSFGHLVATSSHWSSLTTECHTQIP